MDPPSSSKSSRGEALQLPPAAKWLAVASAAVGGLIALASLGTWLAGNWRLGALGAGYVPMAPSSGLILLLLSAALVVRAGWPDGRVSPVFSRVAGWIAVLVSITVAGEFLLGVRLGWEHWLSGTDVLVDGVEVGRMSVLTAGSFVLAAVGLALICPPLVYRRSARYAGLFLAGSGLLFSVVIALGYAAGTPMFYGLGIVPMAAGTAAALAGLNAALLLVGCAAAWSQSEFRETGVGPRVSFTRMILRPAVLIAGVALGTAFAGFSYLRYRQNEQRTAIWAELGAISDLKAVQVSNWRQERGSDAQFLMRAPFVARDLVAYFAQPDSAAARSEIEGWLGLMKGGQRYASVAVFDEHLTPRVSIPQKSVTIDAHLRDELEAVMRGRNVLVGDLYASDRNGGIRLDVIAPVFAPDGHATWADGETVPATAKIIGLVLLRLDPRQFLFPLLQTWPVPSPTAEIVLVRREGNQVLFLNELRFERRTALKMRLRLDDPRLPTARALSGEPGPLEGVDYRNVPVLAAYRAIPGTPWLLVAKVDQAEIYAPLRRQAIAVGAIVAALLLAAALALLVYWRQNQASALRRQRSQLEALVKERTAALDAEIDVRIRSDAQLRLHSDAEHVLREISASLLAAPIAETDAAIETGLQRLAIFAAADAAYLFAFDRDRAHFSQTHLWRAGNLTTRKEDLQGLDIAAMPWWFSQLFQGHDVVVQKVAKLPAAAAVERQLLLSQGVAAIVDVPMMLHGETIGFIGMSSAREGRLWRAEDTDLLRTLAQVMTSALQRKAAEDELQRHREHLEELVSQRTAALYESERRFQSLFEQSHVAIGLSRGGRVLLVNPACVRLFGCERPEQMVGRSFLDFVAPASRPAMTERIDRREVSAAGSEEYETTGVRPDGAEFPLLAAATPIDLADGPATLTFLMDNTARRAAEAAVRKSGERYRVLAETSATGIFIHRDDRVLYANERFAAMLGFTREQILGSSVWDFIAPDERERLRGFAAARLQGRPAPRQYEARALRRNGEPIWVAVTASLTEHEGRPAILGSFIDITERKRAEEALRESEYFLSRSQQVTHLGSYTHDIGSGRWAGTPELDRIFGVDDAYAKTAEGWLALIVPEEREAMRQYLMQDVLGRRQRFDREYQIIRPSDGKRRWVAGHGELEFDAAGQPVRLIGTIQDVTDRRRAEEALRESETRFRTLVECAPDAVFVGTIRPGEGEPRFAYLNAAAIALFGAASDAALMGQPVFDRIHPDHRAAVRQQVGELDSRGFVEPSEQTYLRVDGTVIPVEVTVARITYQGLEGAVVFARDIAERKKTEEKIREQTFLLETATDAIMVCDLDQKVLYWNKGAERMYEWPAPEVLGTEVGLQIYVDRAAMDEAFQTLLREGSWSGEARHFTKARQEITVLSRWTLVRDDEGRPRSVFVINTDITERKKLEAQLYRAQRLESIGQLASGIAHDLNNILAPLVMVAPLLRAEIKNPDTLRLIDILEGNTKRGVDVVKQIMTFARGMKGGKGPVPPRPLIKEIVNVLEETIPRSITVKSLLPEDLWMVEGDATQLHQVLMNLCVNARDAMPDGGTLTLAAENVVVDELYASMSPGAKPGPYSVWLVADTGMGIPQENLDRIFDPFFTTKEPGKGTGLGLSTVLGIVRNHHGFIKVESRVGKGTQFRIYLPAQMGAQAAAETPAPETAPPGHGETVLVVDDEEGVRTLTKRILEHHGYHVLLASEGSEAVVVYAQHTETIEAVLTDLMMPLMDGATLIRALKQIAPGVKILATTGVTDSAQVSAALRLGAREVLRKPYTPTMLLRSLRALLEDRPPPA